MNEIVDGIFEDHRNMELLLRVFERQLAAFEQGSQPDYEVMRGVLHYCADFPGLVHHPQEDQIIERLRARDVLLSDAVRDLAGEHRELAASTARLSGRLEAVWNDGVAERGGIVREAREYLAFYRGHIERENAWFLPLALQALTAEDWADIRFQVAALRSRPDPLFGARPEERFRTLRRELLAMDERDVATAR